MEINDGMVKLDKPTTEIHVYVAIKGEYFKANIWYQLVMVINEGV